MRTVMVLMAMSINSLYQFTLHSLSVPHLGWFEKIFNTPQLHQIHHSKNFAYMDKNFGGIFIIWDKIFGTESECNVNWYSELIDMTIKTITG